MPSREVFFFLSFSFSTQKVRGKWGQKQNTHKTAHDDGHAAARKFGNLLADSADYRQATEDADGRPENHNEVPYGPNGRGMGSVPEKMGNGMRQPGKNRCGQQRV